MCSQITVVFNLVYIYESFFDLIHREDRKAFVNINEIKDYCNLTTQPLSPKFQKQLIQQEASDENDIYIKEVISYRNKYIRTNNKDHKILMVAADFHDKWVDPFVLKVWLDSVKRIQPDYICLAGDIFDFYQVSNFNQDPRRVFSLQEDIDFTIKNILTPTRKAAPDAQIDMLIGNHEFRLIKYLMAEARGLSSLKCLRFGELFQLDKNKINLVCHDRFTENTNINNDKNYIVYDDCFIVSHGTSTGTNHAMAELSKWGLSGCSGHMHHLQESRVYRKTTRQSKTDIFGEMKWISLGCMCSIESGKEYIKDLVRWQQGFLITHIFPQQKNVINEYIEIVNGKAFVGGKLYVKGES